MFTDTGLHKSQAEELDLVRGELATRSAEEEQAGPALLQVIVVEIRNGASQHKAGAQLTFVYFLHPHSVILGLLSQKTTGR